MYALKKRKKESTKYDCVYSIFILAACSQLIFEFLKPIKRFEGR